MDPREVSSLNKTLRNAVRLRELERSHGDFNISGSALNARLAPYMTGKGVALSGATAGGSAGGGTTPSTGPGGEGAPGAPGSPQSYEIICVTGDVIADGGLVNFTNLVQPPERIGFGLVSLPSTDIPVTNRSMYMATIDFEWVDASGGVIDLMVGDHVARRYTVQKGSEVAPFGRLNAEMPIRVRATPNGSSRVKIRLTIQSTSPPDPNKETVIDIDPMLPEPLPAPSTPVVSGVTEYDNAMIIVNWNAVEGAKEYEVRAVRDSDGMTTVTTVPGDQTSVEIEWLDPLTTYRISVWAIDQYGQASVASPEQLFATPGDQTPPAQVSSFEVVSGVNSLFVRYEQNKDPDIKHYIVQLATNSTFSSGFQQKLGGLAGIVPFTELDGQTTYYIRMAAVDLSNNVGPWTATVARKPEFINTDFDYEIVPRSITSDLLAIGAVLTENIGSNVVTGAQLADGSVDVNKLVDNAISASKLAPGAVTAPVIAAGAVTADAIAAGAIVAGKIAAGSISTNEIAANAITADKISTGALTAEALEAGSITAYHIATGTITANSGIIDSLDANVISTGSFHGDRITANTLDINKIRTSTLTSRTITIGTGGNLQVKGWSLARLLIDSTGLRLFNTGGTLMARLNASNGSAYFRGDITASDITSSSLSSTDIDGGTITGSLIRTKAWGTRVEMQSGAEGITFFNSLNNSSSTLRQGNSDGVEFSGSVRIGGSLGNRTLYVGNLKGYNDAWRINSNGEGHFSSIYMSGDIFRIGLYSTGVTIRGAQRDYRFLGDRFAPISGYPRLGWSSGQRWGQIYSTSTSISSASDLRLKTDIEETPLGLDFIKQLRPVHFRHKPKPGINGERYHQGLIAQEVRDLLNQIGYTADKFAGYEDASFEEDSDSDELSLRYGDFIAPLIKAVQELSAQIEEIRNG